MRALLLIALLGALVVMVVGAAVVLLADRRGDRDAQALQAGRADRVREAIDLAYQHLELSPALADAIIDNSQEVDYGSPATVQATTERLLTLAREHRAEEPDLAVIIIDTLRRDPA